MRRFFINLPVFSLAVTLMAVTLGFAFQDKGKPADPTQRVDELIRRFAGEFVVLTPGEGRYPRTFLMGSEDSHANEKPAHKVTFTKSFAMSKYEVTQELYHAIMGNNPSKWKGPRNAIEMMDWYEARDFCIKVTQEMHRLKLIPEKERIRLPSEAEWEYACRAGTTTPYSFGDKLADLTEFAWYKDNSKGKDPPVGMKKANPWGLFDMHGYNWELCQDAWHENYQGAPEDGSAREDSKAKDRVIRGGSWADSADAARSAFRQSFPAKAKNDKVGFRCVQAAK